MVDPVRVISHVDNNAGRRIQCTVMPVTAGVDGRLRLRAEPQALEQRQQERDRAQSLG